MRITPFFLALAVVGTTAAHADAQQRRRPGPQILPSLGSVSSAALLTALRNGGHILACRHAITDRVNAPKGRADLRDRSTQRNLSPEGEEQARALGRALAALEIPIGEVSSSPYARTMESAELAFGRATRDRMLYGSHSRRELRERFNRRPSEGNTVLMTHQGILRSALGYRQPGEGDCVVLRPTTRGPEVIVNVTVPEWQRLAEGGKE